MRLIDCENLTSDMELAEPIYGTAGQLLLQPGVRLTHRYIEHLRRQNLPAIYVADPDTADVKAPCPIRHETRATARRALEEVFDRFTPAAPRMRELSLNLTKEHINSQRFAQAVRRAFGRDSFSGIERSVDAVMSDLLNEDVLLGLNSIKCHDAYTFQHSIDVTIMGIVLARKAGWPAERVRIFGVGCLLHDLGKVLVPPQILNKAEALDAHEFEQVKAHAQLGYQMIKAVGPDRFGLIAQVAYQHHERQDGTGYPRGLKGTNKLGQNPGLIHEFGSVAAVADVYDALSSARPYRAAWAPDKVCASIASWAGDQLNQEAVQLFLSVVTPFPVCCEVVVVGGRYSDYRGVVTHVDRQQLSRPCVRLLYNPQGHRVEPVDLDLRVEQDLQVRSTSSHDPPIGVMRRRRTRGREPSAESGPSHINSAGDVLLPTKLAS